MRFFGLTPDQVSARLSGPASTAPRVTSLVFSIVYGALGLAVVSVVAYSIWALGLIRGPAMWAAIAVVYLTLGGAMLSRLVVGPGSTGRFAALFAVAFFAYAAAYCAFWYGLEGRHLADLWGSATGLALITLLIMRAFEKREGFWLLFAALLVLHSAGYYLGGYLHGVARAARGARDPLGALLYGAGHGLGFGAGLGFLLFHAQSAIKARLRPA